MNGTMAKSFLAIPARHGSERLKDKNVLDFGGKPLVQHTIEQAVEADDGQHTIALVSNDQRVLKVGEKYNIRRIADLPAEYFDAKTPSWLPCWHAMLREEQRTGIMYDVFVVLQPTSPLRPVQAIADCIEKAFSNEYDAATTISPLDPHMTLWTVRIDDGKVKPVFGAQALKTDRHLLETHYMLNGAVKAVRVPVMRQTMSVWGNSLAPVITEFHRSIHISTQEDFDINLFFYNRLKGSKQI